LVTTIESYTRYLYKNRDINVGQDTEVGIVPVPLVIVLYLRPDEQIGGQQFWSIQKLPCNRFERGLEEKCSLNHAVPHVYWALLWVGAGGAVSRH